ADPLSAGLGLLAPEAPDVDAPNFALVNFDSNQLQQQNDSFDVNDVATIFGDEAQSKTEVVFINGDIEDHRTLLNGLSDNVEVIVLDETQDGLTQINEYFAGHSDIDAVHIVSHGNGGGFWLGNTFIDENVLSQRAGEISGWARSLNEATDILIYGCNLASTETGESIVTILSQLTDADVAASDDLSGAAALGGDWELEFSTGTIEHDVVFSDFAQLHWQSTLDSITVTTTADQLDGDADLSSLAALFASPGSDGFVSLREAVLAANNGAGPDAIFLGTGTYTITRTGFGDTLGDHDIRDELSIIGTSPQTTILDGQSLFSQFEVHGDTTSYFSVSNLTIQNNDPITPGNGAAIEINSGAANPTVTVSNVWFLNNSSTGIGDVGGAIYNEGALHISNSLFENSDSERGGAIFNAAGATLTVTNTTFSGNQATNGEGGALYNIGTATLSNVTITNNSSSLNGGGIFAGSPVTLTNSIVAGNTASTGPDINGNIVSGGNNIIGDDSDANGYAGSDHRNVDPLLGALTDNGGDLKTHAPGGGSVAIDGANSALASSTDQLGLLRGSNPDIGAFEVGASTTPPAGTLWFTTDDSVFGGGQNGFSSWDRADVMTFDDPLLNLGAGTTSGTVGNVINFGGGAPQISGLHFVSREVDIAGGAFQLLAGDVLMTSQSDSAVFTSNNTLPLAPGFSATVNADRRDIVVFRPDTPGVYTAGQWAFLIDDPDGANLRAFSLVETATTVGGSTLNAGDFIFARAGATQSQDIKWFSPTAIGDGTTIGTSTLLLDGDDTNANIGEQIHSLELIEETVNIGGVTLNEGQILVSVQGDDVVGENNLSVTKNDIFILDVARSTEFAGAGNGQASATKFFTGEDAEFDTNEERFNSLSLFVPLTEPLANADASAPHEIDEGETLSLDGSISSDPNGTITQYEWDINNDGSFEKTGITADFSWSELNALGVVDDGTFDVALRVTDNDGETDTEVFTATVDNAAPTVTVVGPSSIVAGDTVSLTLNASDPGDDTISTYSIDWGDGTVMDYAYTGASTVVSHTYTNAGFTNNILISANDEDGKHIIGDLLTTSLQTGSVFRFDAGTGEFIEQFGVGDVNSPIDIQVGPDGGLYVTGFGSHNIYRYDSDGTNGTEFVTAASGGLNSPSRIAFGADGLLYVTSFGTDQILRYDGSTGGFVDVFADASDGLNDPDGLTFGPDGQLYVSNAGSNTIFRIDLATQIVDGTFNAVNAAGFKEIAFGPDGNLWVTNQTENDIRRYSAVDGSFVDVFSTTGATDFAGIAFGPDGHVYLSDAMDQDKIIRYLNGNGTTPEDFIATGANGLDQPVNITFTPAHQIFVDPNDAPTLSGGPSTIATTDEDTVSVGVSVTNILAGFTTGDADGDTLGLAITNANGNGTWQYSTDSTDGSDGTWVDVVGVNASNALLLDDGTWVRYSPDLTNGETANIEFRAWDGRSGPASTNGSAQFANPGAGGGTTSFSNTTATANLTVNDVNDAPTFANFATNIDTTNEDTEVEITFAELAAQGDEADIDGTVNSFVVQAVSSGTLRIGANAGSATAFAAGTNDVIGGGLNAYWTPANDQNGVLNAFTVVARDDDGADSATAIQTQVSVNDVNDIPTLTTFVAPVDTTNEDTQVEVTFADLAGQGDEADIDGTVNSFIVQTVSSGTLLIGADAGSATAFAAGTNDVIGAGLNAYWTPGNDQNGILDAFAVVARDDDGADSTTAIQTQVTVSDINDAPTLTSFTSTIESTNEDTEVEITFVELTAQGDEADIDGIVNSFVVQAVSSGTLRIGADAGSATAYAAGTNDVIGIGLNAYWTPGNDQNGTLNAFTAVARDDDGAISATAIQAQMTVNDINDAPTLSNFAATIDSTNEDTEVEITFTELAAQGNEADIDGTVDSFVVQAVSSGSLRIGAAAGSATAFAAGTNDVIGTGLNAYWTPGNDQNGALNAFTVVARDNDGALSGTPIQTTVTTTASNDAPTISGTITNPTATESGTGTNAVALLQAGTVNVTDVDAVDFDGGTITVSFNAYLPGDVLSVAGAPPGIQGIAGGASSDLVITLNAGANIAAVENILEALRFENSGDDPTNKSMDNTRDYDIVLNDGGNSPSGALDSNILSGTITVVDENDAPAFTHLTGPVHAANAGVEESVTFSDIHAVSDASDIDGSITSYVVKNVLNGSLRIGATAASASAWVAGLNDTIDATNIAFWTPSSAASGTIDAF
ncbi:MAG: DUF4347 domain-containing protein, partial [Pseudomonadota bacterium]